MNTQTPSPKALTAGQVDDVVLQLQCDVVDIVQSGAGLSEQEATRIASVVVNGLRQRYGGVRLGQRGLYIPAPSKAERDERIRREFTGDNHKELMARHGIKRTQIYRIVSPRTGKPVGASSPASPASR